MLPPNLQTAREVKQHYDLVYEVLISSGRYHPFLYPWATLGFGVVILYLLFDHRKSPTLQALRLPLFGFLCAFSTWCITTNRARSPAASYGVGLISAWGTLWTASIMCFNDCQTDFKRIERSDSSASKPNERSNGVVISDGGMKQSNAEYVELKTSLGPARHTGHLFWQSYPSSPFRERLEWVIDVFCNFRGVGWSYQTYGIPPPPSWVEAELNNTGPGPTESKPTTLSKTGIRRISSRPALLKTCLISLIIGFFALDLIKVIMHHDAYFWGYMDAAPPAWLPEPIRASHILVKSYRLLVSLAGIYTALLEIFRLGPLFFCFILGPKLVGLRGEAWMNPPDFYGNFNVVWEKGLAGWWGSWWHQTFRFAFEAPATTILKTWNIDKKSTAGKMIGLFTAFILSGSLHACGSYTQLGDTRPLRGPFLFFILQAVGIALQTYAAQILKTIKIPRILCQIGNFLFVMVWMYHTAPLLVDDFAKGGVWLYEPLAISPLRLHGLGAKDDKGWDLWFGLVFWRQGKGWWDTGIAF